MRWKDSPHAVLSALLAIHVLAHIDRNILLGFSPQITRDLALSNAQYGFLAGAVWVLSYGAMAVFTGTLADRYSRTRVIAAGILIWSACTAASGAAQNFEQMVAARFLVASGEAALVPAALSLLVELFSAQRRGSGVGAFFMGIPLGIGFSFLLAGTLGAAQGWRDTFYLLGAIGVVIALPIMLVDDRRGAGEHVQRGAPFVRQMGAVLANLRTAPTVVFTIIGLVLVNMVFSGLAFVQLWLVRERGFDAADVARQIGGLQILFGVLGSLVGGVLGDRLARRVKGGHAGFMVLLIGVCAPLMIAYRFVPAGSALFYVGMCAGFFLPLALYGPANALILGPTPPHMRSSITGFIVLLINVFAIALGNLAIGVVSDRLSAGGWTNALTVVLLAADVVAIASVVFFVLAARGPKVQSAPSTVIAH